MGVYQGVIGVVQGRASFELLIMVGVLNPKP